MSTTQSKYTRFPTEFHGVSGHYYRLKRTDKDELVYVKCLRQGEQWYVVSDVAVDVALSDFKPEIIDAPKRKPFSIDIYEKLPGILRDGCNILSDTADREVFLVSALGILSGLMPNVEGVYDGATVSSNLFVYVLGQYGSGKGAMRYARILAEPIHKQKIAKNVSSRVEFEQRLSDYNEAAKQARKDNKELPPRPPEPNTELLFIPANNSKSGMMELLRDNGGKGIIYETEGDTIADAIRQDYGNFSDLFRKGFHHEAPSLFRRGGKELIEIERPEFSVVVSSTFDQLTNLMPTAENGLFSRFMYYELEPNHKFHNVFDPRKSNYETEFTTLAGKVKTMHTTLNERNEPIKFSLTLEQEERLVELFNKYKEKAINREDPDLNGTVNRLGLITFRIAMILTIIRSVEKGHVYDMTACSDEDFNNALAIVEHLMFYALSVFFRLPKKQVRSPFVDRQQDKTDLIQRAMKMAVEGRSNRAIARELGVTEGTIRNWFKERQGRTTSTAYEFR